jgi:predicted permease
LNQAIDLSSAPHGFTSIWTRFGQSLLILSAAVSFLYVIACANVGGPLLARGTQRQREIAVRLAMGSGRERLVRQLFTESFILAAIGSIAGFAISYWGIRLILALSPRLAAAAPNVHLDGRVVLFTIFLSLLSSILFGRFPAIRLTRRDLSIAFTVGHGGSMATVSRWSMNKVFVMLQISLAMLLLTSAGLFLRTLYNLRHVDVFDRDDIVVFSLSQPVDLDEMLTRIKALPGVDGATVWEFGLLRRGMSIVGPILAEGYKAQPDADLTVYHTDIEPNFFATMGIPLLRGHDFTAQDAMQTRSKAVIISSAMARFFFGSANPVGKYLGNPNSKEGAKEIIGVAQDTKYTSLRDEGVRTTYLPLTKISPNSTFAVRTTRILQSLPGI